MNPLLRALSPLCLLLLAPPTGAVPTVFTAAGANPAAIQTTVDDFRAALGDLNAPDPVALPDGRRQINWDAAPAAVSAPNAFPGDFFNFNASPRARGISFETPGSGLLLSGDVDDGTPVRFEDFDPDYASEFQAFSEERLFAPVGSNIVTASFFTPGTITDPALTDGLGIVFVDVDLPDTTTVSFFDRNGLEILTESVPVADGGLSFLGVAFDDFEVASVSISLGTGVLGDDDDLVDVVVMDDFIFGEPQSVAEPAGLVGLALGAGLLGRRRRLSD